MKLRKEGVFLKKRNKIRRKFTGFLLIYGIIAFFYTFIGSGKINFSAIVLTISMLILFVVFNRKRID